MTFIKPDRDLIAKYNISGPRYTSYPTALQFGPFSSDDYRQSVRESVYRDKSISLYCHLPFCATICYYCACNKIVTKDRSRARHYLDLLKKEIELQAPLFTGRKVSQLHWGGGTPTFLSDDELKELMAAIKDQFPLIGDDEGEFSIEVDPRTVNPQRIELLRSIGFNRLSMGIQDFNESVQKAVNRLQTFDDTKAVITSARKNGFRSISVDLMYGLPFQTLDSVSQTLDQVISLDPDRVSIYNYAHLPDRFKSQRRIDALDLPAASTKLDILMLCIMKLGEAGYIYIGMDHFAKPDDELAVA
ncbi:MAG: oxygen-independent coproporphyrinogen III oxidase, partial [Gammaproteobacteria bacterium]|nr:oxygen-independent coproporphyrinogen III oxidase [Gammaproteobacteria bacterium]